jgi:hypothetical protein
MAEIDWNAAILYARLVAVAESVQPASDYSQANIGAIQQLGYAYLATLYGNELATDISPHAGETVTYGFLALSQNGELVAVVRGTDTIWEWVHDAEFLLVTNPIRDGLGMTEDGFTAIYKSLRIGRASGTATAVASIGQSFKSGQAKSVTVTGHSLGGALATLLTVDVALTTGYRTPVAYTFASPRAGDHLLSASFNAAVPESYRIYNRCDLVPNLPPLLPLLYEHTNTAYELVPPKDAIDGSVVCAHQLTTYLWLLGRQANESTNVYPVGITCRGGAYAGPA